MSSLSRTVDAVASHTAGLDLEDEDWSRALAVNGLLAVDREVETARRLVDRAIATQTDAGQFAYGWGNYPKEWGEWTGYDVSAYKPTANPAALSWGALEFYERTGEQDYLDAVRRQYGFFETVPRAMDGGISRRSDAVELFTEILYFLCPFFVRYGQVVGDDAPIEDAVRQVEVHCDRLQDPRTGLFRHVWRERPDSYPASEFWSRGNGWAAAGLIDTYGELPEGHPGREIVAEAFQRNVEAVVQQQDRSGFLRQLLDDPRSRLETSGTAIYAYAIRRGIDAGVIDDEHDEAARRALDACAGVVTDEGAVTRVSKPPASARSPLGVTGYGQGWFLLAASRYL